MTPRTEAHFMGDDCTEEDGAHLDWMGREREAAALDVERLARAMPEDAVIPYSDWNRDTLARHIAAEYARLAAEPSE